MEDAEMKDLIKKNKELNNISIILFTIGILMVSAVFVYKIAPL